ncbi:MAG: hypothetical protein WCI00_01550 [bacterium]
MNPFIFLEEKDLPKVPFITMVITKQGQQLPYCVVAIRRGTITGATMLLGEFLEDIVKNPEKIFNLDPESSANQRFYIANEKAKGLHKGVTCYRIPLPGETAKWRRKVLSLAVKGCMPEEALKNEAIKIRCMALSNLLP